MKQIETMATAIPLLKQGFVLLMIENKVLVHKKDNTYFLYHENWHSSMNEDDFIQTFIKNTFMIYQEKKEDLISKEKDDEYYQWRFHHQ
ncbi:MAG: hypothetical protein HUJ53_04490 [Holdemanella sp.]|nr:hypothetical protein [Holdemanella sp.]